MTQVVQILKDALSANERAFRNKHTGEVQYVLDGEVDASVWDDVMIIPNLSNEAVDEILSAEGLVQKGERSHPDSFLEAEAHEVWALAQVPPGGGIEGAVERIKSFLANMKVTVVGDLPEGWEAVTAGADEALTDYANKRLRVRVRRVLPPFSGTSGARSWGAPTLSEAITQACQDLGLKRPNETDYIEDLKADLSSLSAEAHEVWALAQVPPGGGIEGAVERIKSFLANMKVTVVGDLPEGWEAVTAGADEALTDYANKRLRVRVRRVLPPFSGTSGARSWGAPTLSEAITQACQDLGLKRPNETDYIEDLKADLSSLSAEANRSANEIVALHEKVAELERVCDATYVAKGADAYHHACAEMERWQEGRKLQDKDPGTEGSLCDGIAWLQERIEELEAQIKESRDK